MTQRNRNFFTVIGSGKYANKRLYFEELCDNSKVLSTELYFMFKNCLSLNSKVFYFINEPNHDIKIPNEDQKFLSSFITIDQTKLYNFSNSVTNIKELQNLDLNLLYKFSIETNKINLFLTYPYLKNDKYCFDFFLTVENNFDLQEFLKLKFNLIKIHSIIELTENNLILDNFQNLFDLNTFKFKDWYVKVEDILSTRPHSNELKQLIPEYKVLLDLMDLRSKNQGTIIYNSEIDKLENIVNFKESQLEDIESYKKLFFSKLCCQLWLFDEKLTNNCTFYSDSLNNSINVNCDFENLNLSPYSLYDLFFNNKPDLFFVFQTPYSWLKK